MPTKTKNTSKKTLDKVQLEQLIDLYIHQDIPLSLLNEQYDISFPQLLLILNRTRGYDYKTNFLSNQNPNFSYEEISPDLIEIPHEITEEYPMTYQEIVASFTRLEELKTIITDIEKHLENYKLKIEELKSVVSSFDIDLVTRIESFIASYDSIPNKDISIIENLLAEYNLKIQHLSEYNKIYEDYLSATKNLALLKKEQFNYQKESRLSTYKREYESIREELVKKNVKLVNWCIRRFFNNIPLPLEETQAFGFEALAIAINEFDYHKGYHFSSYAVPIIVNHIKRHFKELYGMSFGDFVAKESIKYNRLLMKASDPNRFKNPTPTEISELGLIGMTPQRIAKYDDMLDSIIPFSEAYGDLDNESITSSNDMPTTFYDYDIIDKYEDETNIDANVELFTEYIKKLTSKEIQKLLSILTEREREIFDLRFGFSNKKPMSYEQVGRMLNISRGRVEQIESKAIRKLRHPKNIRDLREYYIGTPTFYNYSNQSNEKTYTGDKLYLKLIDLLKFDFTYNGVLTFMNMEELNWQSEDLNNALYMLFKMCEIIKEYVDENQEETDKNKDNYFTYRLKEIFSTFRMPISEYFISYLQENYESIISLISLFEIKHNIQIQNDKIDESIKIKRRFL